jgi:hypothetical protein
MSWPHDNDATERYFEAVHRRHRRELWLWRVKMCTLVVVLAAGIKYLVWGWLI